MTAFPPWSSAGLPTNAETRKTRHILWLRRNVLQFVVALKLHDLASGRFMIRPSGSVLTSMFSRFFQRPSHSSADLYFHAPCFDGVVSSVLALDFLENRWGWKSVHLIPVNYDIRPHWLSLSFSRPTAVVDFLYHPEAAFWADHHASSFSTGIAPNYERNSLALYDAAAPSCALLIQSQLEQRYGHRNRHYDQLVEWATRIDSARYASVNEALYGDSPALQISLAMIAGDVEFPLRLIRMLRQSSLADVAASPDVQTPYRRVRALMDAGLREFRTNAHLDPHGIVTFEVSKRDDSIVSRYAPYAVFPRAPYSAGIIRGNDRVTVTAMRNPWLDFEPINLGKLFEAFGGGGHKRIGSIVVEGPDADQRAKDILRSVLTNLEQSAAEHNSVTSKALTS